MTDIINSLASGRFELTEHAEFRMAQRNITKDDIRNVGYTYSDIVPQDDGKVKVTGSDLYGEELTVIVVDDGGVLVVTVFGG